ncbi:multiple sugar transport system permease protein [Paenibacillus algorifonticola]|uniref:Multiple sugar transport system permease protein n=1 Tax=Paenibacillus algorifonticola TaxID=684063 RepID=A0A1I2GBW8_9BACL|nr:carbohydrate ABC transporter permease [Paenibacillus algorifonticola]SFF14246.1 multiple sugar transport system permease protein [Paenibacillus algorifonticola]
MALQANQMKKWLLYAVLIFISMAMVLPLLIMIFTALKGDAEFSSGVNTFFPKEWKFTNFILALQATNWAVYFKNSLIVTAITVAGSLFFNTLSGYAFARLSFKGRDLIFIALLLGLMVPAQVTIIPQFMIMKSIPLFGGNDIWGNGGNGWLDTYAALIIPELSGAFGIFFARQFYLSFPKELDDAAGIDGCGVLARYFKIYLPMSGPVIASLGILKTVAVWNDFFHPLVFTTKEAMRTVQLGLSVFQGQFSVAYNLQMAATLVVSLPLIIMFFVFQKYFVQSMLSSSVKG